MMERKTQLNYKNIIFYILGFLFLGLGVNLMYSSGLGAGAWDTVSINIRNYFEEIQGITWVTIGSVSIVVNSAIMISVLIYRKKMKFLLMIIPISIVGVVIDFWNIVVFNDFQATIIGAQVLFLFLGMITLPLGLALVVKSQFPAFVFEELTFMFSEITKMSFKKTRIFIEVFGITIGAIFGALTYLSDGHLGAVGIGSVLFALTIGPTLQFYLRILGVDDPDSKVIENIKNESNKFWLLLKENIISQIKIKALILYSFGMLFIPVGVILMKRSHIGLSSWDTLHNSINEFSLAYDWMFEITLGLATIIVATIFMVAVIIMNQNFKYILMAIPIIIVGNLITYLDEDLLLNFTVEGLLYRVPVFLLGIAGLPLGGAFLIASTYPAGVFDEFMLAVMKKLNSKKLVLIRAIMELSAVTLAFIIGQFAGIGFGMINVGTLIFSLSVGWFVQSYLKIFARLGIFENKQIE